MSFLNKVNTIVHKFNSSKNITNSFGYIKIIGLKLKKLLKNRIAQNCLIFLVAFLISIVIFTSNLFVSLSTICFTMIFKVIIKNSSKVKGLSENILVNKVLVSIQKTFNKNFKKVIKSKDKELKIININKELKTININKELKINNINIEENILANILSYLTIDKIKGINFVKLVSSKNIISSEASYQKIGISLKMFVQSYAYKNLLKENIVKVKLGQLITVVLTDFGTLYACGANSKGELANIGENKTIKTSNSFFSSAIRLKKIDTSNIDGKIVDIAFWADHSTILTSKGKVYVSGSNVFGQLGIGIGKKSSENHGGCTDYIKKIDKFKEMPLGNIKGKVVDISVGNFSTAVLTNEGRVYITGRDLKDNLGYATCETRGVLEEIPLRNNRVFTNEVNNRVHRNIIKVTLAGGNAVAQTDNGEVYICSIGERDYLYRKTLSVYTLGFLGSETERIEMVSLELSVGGYKSIAVLTDNGKVYVYGSNQNGELGLGDFNSRDNLEEISLENIDGKVIKVEIGIHMLVLTDKGNIYACGRNDYGQLGLVDNLNRSSLEKISLENINGKIIDVSIGNSHTAIQTDKGNIYTCGSNNCGQLGLGLFDTESLYRNSLEQIPNPTYVYGR